MKRKKEVIILLTIVVICLFIKGLSLRMNKREVNDNKALSLMLQENINSKNYQKSNSNTWPKEGYVFNPYLSRCENGSKLEWDNQNKTIKLSTNKTDKCYVYFDIAKTFTLLTKNTEIVNHDTTITNILKNGSFENNFDNWGGYKYVEIVPSTETHGQNALLLKANSMDTFDDAIITQQLQNSIITNHYYYGRLKFKSDANYTSRDARFEIWKNVFNLSFFNKDIKSNIWTIISSIGMSDFSDEASESYFRDFVAGGSVDTYTDELMLIDLTASFGDNYPNKEWLDKNLIYFDDLVNIKTVEGLEGIFDVNDTSGTFRCSDGGVATIVNDKIVITGTELNTTCILE